MFTFSSLKRTASQDVLGEMWATAWGIIEEDGTELGLCRREDAAEGDPWFVHCAFADNLFPLWSHGVGCIGVYPKTIKDSDLAAAVEHVLQDAKPEQEVADRIPRALLEIAGQLVLPL